MKTKQEGSLCEVVANVVDCDIEGSEFELQLPYCIHFLKNTFEEVMNPFTPSAMG